MIFERTILEALTPDPLEAAKSKVQTRQIKAVIQQRYEEMHRGALQPLRASVPTEPASAGCSGSAS